MNGRSILHKNAISMVVSGEKTMLFADKTIRIHDDEFHFLSSGNCLASVELSPKKTFHSILIFFDNKILSDFHLKYAAQIAKVKTRTQPEPYLAFKKDEFVLNFI